MSHQIWVLPPIQEITTPESVELDISYHGVEVKEKYTGQYAPAIAALGVIGICAIGYFIFKA
jgi:hypothetical protein